jgi:hypothetical protein
MCIGEDDFDHTIDNQNWVWDPDYCTDPTIYSDPD